MVKRSLRACPARVHQAKRAFALKGWTQENLAGEVNLKTRQPIWRFFSGQPVERQIFVEICGVLDLDWREIAIDPPAEFPELGRVPETAPIDLDELVTQVRAQRSAQIQARCGILQLLAVGHPVAIADIYVDVRIGTKLLSQQWCELSDLQQLPPVAIAAGELTADRDYRSGMQAVATYAKLRAIGRIGSGKTLFLKHLAIACDRGEIAADCVPIFISLSDYECELRDRPKLGLREYITELFADGIANPVVVETLLQSGRAFLTIDGMDELGDRRANVVAREVRKLTDRYPKNRYVVTCRTAARKFQLRGFTDVEIAPLTASQIDTFVNKWFATLTASDAKSAPNLSLLLRELASPQNWRIHQLATTPLFLHSICSIFAVQGKFPTQRAEIYERASELLCGGWDEAKGRDRDCCPLLAQKLRLLTQVAAATFERGEYVLARRSLEYQIGDYLRQNADRQLSSEELQLESAAALAKIETQQGLLVERAQGIFAFSAVGLQEYFTARKLVSEEDIVTLERSLRGLVRHLTDVRWREVFLLTASLLRNADGLMQMMQQQLEILVDREPAIQDFLMWASQTLQPSPGEPQRANNWIGQLQAAITDYRPTHYAWQLHPLREELLQSYCYVHQLLFDCLAGATVSTAVRQEIAAALALPDYIRNANLPWIPTLLLPPQKSPQSA